MSDFFAERDWMGLTDVIETDTEFQAEGYPDFQLQARET